MSTRKTRAINRKADPAETATELPPRARILKSAHDLFYGHGIRGVGVEAVAAAADTNKMTLYRHFSSKDELVAEYLRDVAAEIEASWEKIGRQHADDPKGHIIAWLKDMGRQMERPESRGCPITNAAIELPDTTHPGRQVIEAHKRGMRRRFAENAKRAGLKRAEMIGEQLLLLLDGAGVSLQTIGHESRPIATLIRHAEWLLEMDAGK
ncbi:TetR/AcrR family transcriptional regulator [Dongia rigui]|uniref:TetR/AcrR family transcriptional regulator n=1 Tax=Dongia rigui TaxID=940149 RepID=A0ABU5DX89_9PROT|nr:TetR/AcrR family transcriptional regulator [Dongia rigui]MDY0871612.1 TetR/AcrR family transcriptional regulator [Dongia rigui]